METKRMLGAPAEAEEEREDEEEEEEEEEEGGGRRQRGSTAEGSRARSPEERNERERRRLRRVNAGFAALQKRVPQVSAARRASKLQILRAAQSYISHLQRAVRAAGGPRPPRGPSPGRGSGADSEGTLDSADCAELPLSDGSPSSSSSSLPLSASPSPPAPAGRAPACDSSPEPR
ncbi:achaete-scute homolog 2-like [Lepisosteus oculatus]|uniref:achaete-scute homolog 2-like n=1 Tax=Lepisosteus oculatus TaxID=7918 RepID=UPI0037192F9B